MLFLDERPGGNDRDAAALEPNRDVTDVQSQSCRWATNMICRSGSQSPTKTGDLQQTLRNKKLRTGLLASLRTERSDATNGARVLPIGERPLGVSSQVPLHAHRRACHLPMAAVWSLGRQPNLGLGSEWRRYRSNTRKIGKEERNEKERSTVYRKNTTKEKTF